MRDQDIIDMARRCIDEIKMLRRINEELAPKADAYDSIRTVLNLLPRPSHGMTEDLVWRLERQIKDIEKQLEKNGDTDK